MAANVKPENSTTCVIHEGPYCMGCHERLTEQTQVPHEVKCVAFRDYLIAKKLAAQAHDDGYDDCGLDMCPTIPKCAFHAQEEYLL